MIHLYNGDVIEFTYKGGSKPGAKRTIYVLTNSGASFVKAWDFDKDDLRTFTLSKMSDIRYLTDDEMKVVSTDCLPKSVASTISRDFDNEGWKTYKNGDTIVAVKPIKRINTTLTGDWYNGYITFQTAKGTTIKLGPSIYGGNVRLTVNNCLLSNKCTAEELQRVLST
jgi:hypothetical protein